MDRSGLADFLRRRRESLQPEDMGLPRGQRRRTDGLRREEVASLCHMSSDYYTRLERQRGPQPSEQMLISMAQGLRLSLEERDHLFRLAGHQPPPRAASGDHIDPGLLGVLDTLTGSPAEIVTELGETLRQNPLSIAVTGDNSRYTGPERSIGYRWFTLPEARQIYLPEEHPILSRTYASGLRRILTLRGPRSHAAFLAELLLEQSEEFRTLWNDHQVGDRPDNVKRLVHPQVGSLRLNCRRLHDSRQSHTLLIYTADPESDSHEKLQILAAGGVSAQR